MLIILSATLNHSELTTVTSSMPASGVDIKSVASSSVVDLIEEDVSKFTKDCIRAKLIPIETLHAELDFRPDWAVKEGYDVEDRSYILPFLLGDKIDTTKFSRRVYIDIGSNEWTTSYKWQLDNNPVDFDEYHLFESAYLTGLPSDEELGNVIINSPARAQRHFPKITESAESIGKSLRERTFVHNVLVGLKDDQSTSPRTLNITRYLYEVARIHEKGTYVTVKFDIEGHEWEIIPSWEKDGTFDHIHELFMEVHYGDSPRLSPFGWDNFSGKRQDAEEMFKRLREQGVQAHAWP